MGEPVGFVIDDETKERLEATARSRGMTVQEYLNRMSAESGDRRSAVREWSSPRESLPASKPRTAQEMWDQLMERQSQMLMMKMMGNMGGGSSDGGESVAEVVRREVREALGKNGGGEDDPETMIERMLAKKARLKALKELAGDDQPANRYLDDRLREVTDKLGDMAKENQAMRAENEKLRQERLAEDQRRAQDETKTQIAQVADAVSFLQEQIKNQRSSPTETKDAFQEAEEMMDKLDRIKKKLGAGGDGGKEPDLVDRLDRIGDVATKHFATAADSAAKIIAATHGQSPAEYASEPMPAAYTEEAGSATAALSAGEIDKLRSSVEEMRKSGYACDPTDYTTWPDVSYSVQKANQLIATSRQDWVRTYGHLAAPSLPGIPKHDPPMSAPPPPPEEPPKSAASQLDLSRLLSSGTHPESEAPAVVESEVEEAALPEPEADPQPPSSPLPTVTSKSPVTVDADGKIVQDSAVAGAGTAGQN